MSDIHNGIIPIMRAMNIGCVLDVGANVGQFALGLLRSGFPGHIISFEPLADCFSELTRATISFPNWYCQNLALGAEDGDATINVSANRVSSSILPATSWSIAEHAPIARIAEQAVKVRRLDTLWPELPFPAARSPIMLKVDVQGFEAQVLSGLGNRLRDVDLILIEASLIPVYEGEKPVEDLIRDLRGWGLFPVWIGSGWGNQTTGQVFQCDIAFSHHPIVGRD